MKLFSKKVILASFAAAAMVVFGAKELDSGAQKAHIAPQASKTQTQKIVKQKPARANLAVRDAKYADLTAAQKLERDKKFLTPARVEKMTAGWMAILQEKNLPPVQIVALVSNAIAESGGDPSAFSIRQEYGLFQVHPINNEEFKRITGRNIYGSSARAQIDFVLNKTLGNQPWQREFWNTNDVRVATKIFCQKVEIPLGLSRCDQRAELGVSLYNGSLRGLQHKSVYKIQLASLAQNKPL